MRALISAVALGVSISLAIAPAQAKSLSRIIAEMGLSPADFEMMGTAAASLYQDVTPRAGSQASWSNPDTRSHGTVTLREASGGCVRLTHEMFPKGEPADRRIRLRFCKASDGRWVLQP
ncbi:hypothetical protein [Primorskyibacter sp. S87]|uniref:hypothetical protein n=1 Tax=Primorskyibacter sp. S87 TaxID=3415126 RepID=UPI003C7A3E92